MIRAKSQTCRTPCSSHSFVLPHRALAVFVTLLLCLLTHDARAEDTARGAEVADASRAAPPRIDYEIGASLGRDRGEVRFDERVTLDASLLTQHRGLRTV